MLFLSSTPKCIVLPRANTETNYSQNNVRVGWRMMQSFPDFKGIIHRNKNVGAGAYKDEEKPG